jgi:COP9 signalosome complex subunit 2
MGTEPTLIVDRYDFEYEDEDEEQSGDVDIENKYYNAKQVKGEDPESAIDEFLGIPALEEEKSDWYGYATVLQTRRF